MTNSTATSKSSLSYVRSGPLLLVYILPLIAGIVALYDFTISNELLRYNSLTPEVQILFLSVALLIDYPHLLASLFPFVDREYFISYKKPLLITLFLAITASIITPLTLGYGATFVLLISVQMHHHLAQQSGICMIFLRQPPSKLLKSWKWINSILVMTAYCWFFGENEMADWWLNICYYTGLILVIPALVSTLLMLRQPYLQTIRLNNPVLYIYIVITLWLPLFWFGLAAIGYAPLALLSALATHGLTALIIYAVHDQNRNKESIKNPLYHLSILTRISPLYLCPLMAIIIIALTVEVGNQHMLYYPPILFLAFFHYFIEGYIWKRSTLHRQHTLFKTV